MSVIKKFDAVRTTFDVQSRGSLVSDKMIFMRDIVLMEHLGTLEAWKLKPDRIPTRLANVVTEAKDKQSRNDAHNIRVQSIDWLNLVIH